MVSYGITDNNRVYKVMTLINGSNGVKCSYDMKEYFNINTNLPYPTITRLYSHNNIFYASSNNGNVYKSRDCINWISLNIGYPLNSIDSSSNNVFVGSSHGLHSSADNNEFEKFVDSYGILDDLKMLCV